MSLPEVYARFRTHSYVYCIVLNYVVNPTTAMSYSINYVKGMGIRRNHPWIGDLFCLIYNRKSAAFSSSELIDPQWKTYIIFIVDNVGIIKLRNVSQKLPNVKRTLRKVSWNQNHTSIQLIKAYLQNYVHPKRTRRSYKYK